MLLAAVDAPSLALAFAAGFVSFVSPCCLPLVPGYLAAVSGRRMGQAAPRRVDPRVLARSLLFVGSFSAVFIVLGLSATLLGSLLLDGRGVLNVVAGVAIVAMGLLFAGSVFAARLNWQWRPRLLSERAGRGGPVLTGAAFAVAWTPCIGPTLGAILGLAATRSGTAQGAALLAMYSAGLAVPFLLSALAFDATSRSLAFFKRHHAQIQVGAGLVLVGMGVLVVTGQLFRLNAEIQRALGDLGLNIWESL
jgi:cytochrome c-type biogenesis protein